MAIYLNKFLMNAKSAYQFEKVQTSHSKRFYENYTNFIDIRPTKYEIINKSLKIALAVSTLGVFIIVSVSAILLDTANETSNLFLKAYRSFRAPISKLEFIKKLSKENKKRLSTIVALTAFITFCFFNRDKITDFGKYIKKFFVKEEEPLYSIPYGIFVASKRSSIVLSAAFLGVAYQLIKDILVNHSYDENYEKFDYKVSQEKINQNCEKMHEKILAYKKRMDRIANPI